MINNFYQNENYYKIKNIKAEFTEICIEHIDIITNNSSTEFKSTSKLIDNFLNNVNANEIHFNMIKTNILNKINGLINIFTYIAQENNIGFGGNHIMEQFSLINKLSLLQAKISGINPLNTITFGYDNTPTLTIGSSNLQNLNNLNNQNHISNLNGLSDLSNFQPSQNSFYINTLNPPFALNNSFSNYSNLSIPVLNSNPISFGENINNMVSLNNLNSSGSISVVPTSLPTFTTFNPTQNSTIESIKTNFSNDINSVKKLDIYNDPDIMDMKNIKKIDEYKNSKNTLFYYFKKDDTNISNDKNYNNDIKILKIHKKSVIDNYSSSSGSTNSSDENIYNFERRKEIKNNCVKVKNFIILPLTKIQGKEIKINFKKSFVQI